MQYIKSFLGLLIFCCTSLFIFAQVQSPETTDLTGLWKGTLYNDTTKLFYKYEIAISKNKSGYDGFSHTWFILDDKQYYGVKKVKVNIIDGKIIIEDDGLIANNYPVAPAKGVRQLNVLELQLDSNKNEQLIGPFTTNATKKYSVLTGYVSLNKKSDFWQSALVPHLQELQQLKKLSFVEKEIDQTKNTLATITPQHQPAVQAPETATIEETNSATTRKENIIQPKKSEVAIASSKRATKTKVKSNTKSITTENENISNTNQSTNSQITEAVKKEKKPAEDFKNRTTVVQHVVQFKSDSLQLALYDNGEVDGDTVTVLLNGKVFMAKERLSTNAVKKTIFIPAEMDSIELVMYAENLGTISPNTGLLVVKDGKDTYEIRFTGDLQKNAGIIFRRKTK